ncbi:unnamed protein product [Moneuplotes crassus]|uniref:C2H2-type domain-containing protein n=1 Tax=Euplotes crassus TaxID=5936 RepID=A0AAD1Y8U6_EUPCR|nr:unnamed protein product [Moneuplotes crassus]
MHQTFHDTSKGQYCTLLKISCILTQWKNTFCSCDLDYTQGLKILDALQESSDLFCKCPGEASSLVLNGQQPKVTNKDLVEEEQKVMQKKYASNPSESTDKELEILKECEYSLRYDPVGNTTRTRRIVICEFESCKKEFIKAWNFLDHYRMHQGVRPFVCSVCSKNFTQKGNLKKHMRQHINKNVKDRKIHKCHLCPKSYTERYNLRSHYEVKHPGSCMISESSKMPTKP